MSSLKYVKYNLSGLKKIIKIHKLLVGRLNEYETNMLLHDFAQVGRSRNVSQLHMTGYY